MPDNERNTTIVFDDGTSIQVQSTIVEIKGQIEANKHLPLPLIEVVDEGGGQVWINANHIRELRLSE
jgi:hypothetical protein